MNILKQSSISIESITNHPSIWRIFDRDYYLECIENMKGKTTYNDMPLKVMKRGDQHILYAGHELYEAAKSVGIENAQAYVTTGENENDLTWEDLRGDKYYTYSTREKTAVITLALQHPYAHNLSSSALAHHIGVSTTSILRYRRRLEAGETHTRQGRDGKLRESTTKTLKHCPSCGCTIKK